MAVGLILEDRPGQIRPRRGQAKARPESSRPTSELASATRMGASNRPKPSEAEPGRGQAELVRSDF